MPKREARRPGTAAVRERPSPSRESHHGRRVAKPELDLKVRAAVAGDVIEGADDCQAVTTCLLW